MSRQAGTYALVLILPLLIAVGSVPLANASHLSKPVLGVWPETLRGVPGGATYRVSVNLTEINNFVAFSLNVTYDPSVITVLNATLDGTLFDPFFAQSAAFLIALEIVEPPGLVFVAATLLGTAVSVTGSAPILFLTVAFDTYGTSPLDLVDDKLVVSVGGTATLADHITIDGKAETPARADAELVQWRAKADHHLDLSTDGNNQTFLARVKNTGSLPAYVLVQFKGVSELGGIFFTRTAVQLLTPGSDSVTILASLIVDPIPARYHVQATLLVGSDGAFFVKSNTKTFSFSVVL